MSRIPLTPAVRKKIFERDSYTCQYCGRSAPDVVLEIDHIIPINKNGTNDPQNLITCCLECNRRKHDHLLTDDLRQELYDKVHYPERDYLVHTREKTSDDTQSKDARKKIYVFPAIVDFADDGIGIEFPDIPGCLPCVELGCEDVPSAIMHNAREALGLHLYNMEDDNDPIPEPSDILSIPHENNQAVVLVDVYMPTVRERIRNRNVNKMCTVPSWLVHEAERQGLNFSHTLQDALMLKLGVKRSPKRRR